jgi:hypothetical protein
MGVFWEIYRKMMPDGSKREKEDKEREREGKR